MYLTKLRARLVHLVLCGNLLENKLRRKSHGSKREKPFPKITMECEKLKKIEDLRFQGLLPHYYHLLSLSLSLKFPLTFLILWKELPSSFYRQKEREDSPYSNVYQPLAKKIRHEKKALHTTVVLGTVAQGVSSVTTHSSTIARLYSTQTWSARPA